MTASVMYNLPVRGGYWASIFLWGRTRSLLVVESVVARRPVRNFCLNSLLGRIRP